MSLSNSLPQNPQVIIKYPIEHVRVVSVAYSATHPSLPALVANIFVYIPLLLVAAVTQSPTFLPSASPSTSEPTMNPTLSPTETSIQVTTFFVVGDVPYNPQQALELGLQMDGIPATADFVVHVGDIRSASENNQCRLQEYQEVSELLQRSAVPVFIVPGDSTLVASVEYFCKWLSTLLTRSSLTLCRYSRPHHH